MANEVIVQDKPQLPEAAASALSPSERRDLLKALRGLKVTQRLFLHALLASVTQSEALRRMKDQGLEIEKSVASRWTRDPRFVVAWRLLERAYVRNITKEGVLAKTEAILEHSMTPQPILHRGEDTGFREVDVGSALKAIELQGKALGVWQDEQQKIAVELDIDFGGRAVPGSRDPLLDIEAIDVAYEDVPPPAAQDGWLD